MQAHSTSQGLMESSADRTACFLRMLLSAARELSSVSLPPRCALMERQPWPQRSSLKGGGRSRDFSICLTKAHQFPADRKQGEHGQLGLTKDCQPHSVLAALFLQPPWAWDVSYTKDADTEPSLIRSSPLPLPTFCYRCSSGGRCSRGPEHTPAGQPAHERQGGCVFGLDLVSSAALPYPHQAADNRTPMRISHSPSSLGNSLCLWVQKCLNQNALET